MDETTARKLGLKVIADKHCPQDRVFLVSKKDLDRIAKEFSYQQDLGETTSK